MDTAVAVNAAERAPRNPGPSWGFAFLQWAERWWPRWIFRPALMLGTWIALPFMGTARRHSRAYLVVVLGREPSLLAVWRHFFAFTDFLLLKLRVARGVPHRCELDPRGAPGFEALVGSGAPALFGTFHFGRSDLLGFLLARGDRRVAMIRQRVGNSDDTRWLGRQFADSVSFLWINDRSDLIFALKDALDAGCSLAMQCDRFEFAAKAEPFSFLGAQRMFPFTIYHLALMFARPVMFCVGAPAGPDRTRVIASPVFRPDPHLSREANFAAARRHFQAVLAELETLVRQHPTLWFNFLPLNPPPPASATAG
jgi:predicted LPLAT superfamily acyltransferase